jgi:hypothetical protein
LRSISFKNARCLPITIPMVGDTKRIATTSPNRHNAMRALLVSLGAARRGSRCRASIRSRSFHRAIVAGVVCSSLALASGAQLAFGASAPLDPSSNITLPATGVPSACATDPTGPQCENAAIVDLDAARTRIGLGQYLLPRDFVSLAPTTQLFILTNLDRVAYGIKPIAGLNHRLDAAAAQGVRSATDPVYPAGMPPVDGWASNWASGYQNALFAYYGWVYDDGFGSGNLSCTSPRSQGCWAHRNNIIESENSATAVMGAAAGPTGTGTDGYAMEIADPHTRLTYQYTWAQAIAAGTSPPANATVALAGTLGARHLFR